ncbi:MAG TPA: hypothetical protein PKY99_03185 [Turneriella sp.]|nr:hypothetical protein [Turneriella sp.]
MAKKVFYNRRYKMPGWLQPYAVWAFAALITLAVVFFTSVERVGTEPAQSLTAAQNGFAEGLFYELRDAEPDEKYEVTLRYAERLKKKYDLTLRETNGTGCRVVHLARGSNAPWLVAAALQNGQTGGVFSVLVFLDRLAAASPSATIATALVFPRKNCNIEETVQAMQSEKTFAVFVDAENNPAPYDRINALRNLHLRRFFPSAFLMPERTHWANVLALTADAAPGRLFTVPAGRAKESVAELLAANPLLRHPAQADANAQQLSKPVAIYLGAETQLHTGGFTALLVLVWLLAFIPFANALGTFRERIDLGSALTSGILYALAFVSYLLFYKLILQFAKSDFSAVVFALLLVPAVFFPLRILQKTMLRAELNRPGLHLLVQLVLTAALFTAPISGVVGLVQLTAASGFSRASLPRKLLRLLAVLAPLTLLYFAAREPMGSFANFLAAVLPAFSGASLLQLIMLCIVGGNLTALLFVPREKI